MKKTIVIPVAIAVLVLSVFAGVLGAGKAQAATKAGVVKIGMILDLTGNEATVGLKQQKAMNWSIAEIGPVAGNTVQVVYGDAKSDPALAISEAKRLVNSEKVVALFGPTQVDQKQGVTLYSAKAKKPLFFYNPSPLALFKKNPYQVGSGGSFESMTSVGATHLRKVLKAKTIATLSQKNTAGTNVICPFVKRFKALGGKVLAQKWYVPGNTDWNTTVNSLPKADYIVAWCTGTDGVAFWNSYAQLGAWQTKGPVFGPFHGGFTDFFVYMQASTQGKALLVQTPSLQAWAPDSGTAANNKFIADWKVSNGGRAPGDDGESGPYQAYLAFVNAVQKAKGKTTAAAIMKAVKTLRYVGPEGVNDFRKSLCATKDWYVVQQQGSAGYKTLKKYSKVPPKGI